MHRVCRCGVSFVVPHKERRPKKYCSRHCYQLLWTRDKNGYQEPQVKKCVVCEVEFLTPKWHPKAETCSHACTNKLWNRRNPAKYRLYMRLSSRRRYARIKGVDVGPIDWPLITRGQKARCWWCGKRKKLAMDHVIPVSKGGAHKQENIVGACKSCNSRKSNALWARESGELYKGELK